MSSNICKIIYINLDKRPDRRSEIEGELSRMGLVGERFPAIETKPGYIGCSQSHRNILLRAIAENWENVLILEDDFQFVIDKKTFEERMVNFFTSKIPYDVLMISRGCS